MNTEKTRLSNSKKIISGLTILVGLAGKAHAENTDIKVEDAKITPKEITVEPSDSLSMVNDSLVKKNSGVKISNFNQSTFFQFTSFGLASPKGIKLVVSPIFVLKPVVSFNDKVNIGFSTTFKVHNYARENFAVALEQMYAHAELKVKNSEIFVQYGKFPVICYFCEFSNYMPITGLFVNAIRMNAGPYLPCAVVSGIKNNNFMVALGYNEQESSGFQMKGKGDAVACAEIRTDNLKIGTVIIVKEKFKVTGSIQTIWQPTEDTAVLLEVTNLGQPNTGFHAACEYDLNNKFFIVFNGYYQMNDGVQGATAGVVLNNGVYVVAGVLKNDPMIPESQKKPVPMAEVGIKHAIIPRIKR